MSQVKKPAAEKVFRHPPKQKKEEEKRRMSGKLIGFRKFKSKKGTDVCKAYVEVKATAREVENGSSSVTVDEVFLFGDDSRVLQEEHVGKSVDYTYNRRGFLEDFRVTK